VHRPAGCAGHQLDPDFDEIGIADRIDPERLADLLGYLFAEDLVEDREKGFGRGAGSSPSGSIEMRRLSRSRAIRMISA
jgi:phosphomannomutase